MKSKTLLLIVAAIAAILFLPKLIGSVMTPAHPSEPPPPAPATPKKHKTIVGNITDGITGIFGGSSNPYAQGAVSLSNVIGSIAH